MEFLVAKFNVGVRLEKHERVEIPGTMNRALEMLRDNFPATEELHYRGPADFVLQHGEHWAPRPHRFELGGANICYGNAILGALRYGLRYVEGYGICHYRLDPEGPVIMPHAWNVDRRNRVVDLTWTTDRIFREGRVDAMAYCGVEFSIERADHASWINDACILVDPEHGWPLLREPWRGEDRTIQWETSGLLELERRGASKDEISAWLEAQG